MKILIIEDEENLARPLKKTLEKQGFAVDWAGDGEKGLFFTRKNEYDCILLDLNLPKVDGIELARTLRETPYTVPIIMVTARSQIYDKLEGFDSGADDYITKPFDLKELIARINAVIKRSSVNRVEKLCLGKFELIPDQNIVQAGKSRVELSTKETAILEYLIRNKGKIVSTEELLEHVWDSEIDTFTQTVKTHIKTIRQKLDPTKKLIKTVRGKGYQVNQ